MKKSRDRSVDIALGYGLDDWGSSNCRDKGRIYSLHYYVQIDSAAHPTSCPFLGS